MKASEVFEKNVFQFLFIVTSFLCFSFLIRGLLIWFGIEGHLFHLISSILILGLVYGFAKSTFIHFTRKKKLLILLLFAGCVCLSFAFFQLNA